MGKPSCTVGSNFVDLRSKEGFDGYISGDEGAVEDVLTAHEFASTPEGAVKAVISAGTIVARAEGLRARGAANNRNKSHMECVAGANSVFIVYGTRALCGVCFRMCRRGYGWRLVSCYTSTVCARPWQGDGGRGGHGCRPPASCADASWAIRPTGGSATAGGAATLPPAGLSLMCGTVY
jgi:hypothetical protein